MSRGKNPYVFLIILIALLVSYLPSLQGYYVFADGVKFWNRLPGQIENYIGHKQTFHIGRFLGAYIQTGYGLLVNSVYDLNIIRFISVLQLSVCAFLCFLVMKKGFVSSIDAFFASIMLFTLPPFQVMVSWTGAAFLTNAVLLSCFSAWMSLKIPLTLPVLNRLINRYALLSVFLLFCSYCVYPSAATFYWVMVLLVFLFYRSASPSAAKHHLMNHYGIGLGATGMYALVLRIFRHNLYTAGIYNPTAVTTKYREKFIWFIQEPLMNSLNLWEIFPGTIFALTVAVFLVFTGLFFLFKALRSSREKSGKKKVVLELFFSLALLFSLILLGFLPNLVAVANISFYRCCSALTAMIVAVLVGALYQWRMILPKTAGRRIITGILFLGCLYGMYKASNNILYYRVIPSHLELTYIKKFMKQAVAEKHERININLPQWRFVKHRYDEFGGFITNGTGDIYPLLTCALRELAYDGGMDLQRFVIELNNGKATYFFREQGKESPLYVYSFYITITQFYGKKILFDEKIFNIDMTKLCDLNK